MARFDHDHLQKSTPHPAAEAAKWSGRNGKSNDCDENFGNRHIGPHRCHPKRPHTACPRRHSGGHSAGISPAIGATCRRRPARRMNWLCNRAFAFCRRIPPPKESNSGSSRRPTEVPRRCCSRKIIEITPPPTGRFFYSL